VRGRARAREDSLFILGPREARLFSLTHYRCALKEQVSTSATCPNTGDPIINSRARERLRHMQFPALLTTPVCADDSGRERERESSGRTGQPRPFGWLRQRRREGEIRR